MPDPDPHHFDGDHDGIGCELPPADLASQVRKSV